MKILQAGAKSIHVSSYITALDGGKEEIHLLSEEACNFKGVEHEWHVSFRSKNPFTIWKNVRKLKRILAKVNPEIIHVHQVNRLAYFVTKAASKLRIPVVTTAWGSDVLVIPKQNKFFRTLVTKSLKRSAIVTADSQEMIAAMIELVPQQTKYVHLQYGIDPVTPAEKEKIVYSNRLHTPLYRIDQVVRYFRTFSESYPDWQLVIAATGPETTTLEELVTELGLDEKVTFAGWLDREANREWYARSAIYISIPESDGTSVSVLEAMSAGCIPVLSDLAVSHEWIKPDVNGVIEVFGSNPLVDAMAVDVEKCAEINHGLVTSKASRTASIKEFRRIYQQLTHAGKQE
jgi:L-malate glycosyltransferase